MSSTTGRRSGGGVIKSVDLLQEYMEKEQKRRAFLRGLLGTTALGGAALAGCGDNGGNTPAPGTDAEPSDLHARPVHRFEPTYPDVDPFDVDKA